MPRVNIPDVGVVNFPDNMTPEQIQAAIENDILKQPAAPEEPGMMDKILGFFSGAPEQPVAPQMPVPADTGIPAVGLTPEQAIQAREGLDPRLGQTPIPIWDDQHPEPLAPVTPLARDAMPPGAKPYSSIERDPNLATAGEVGTAILQMLGDVPEHTAASAQYLRGKGMDFMNPPEAVLQSEALAEQRRGQPGGEKDVIPGLLTIENFRNTSQNIPFSLLSMGAGLGAGLPAGAVGGPIAGFGAGAAASGAAAYQQDVAMFLREVYKAANESSMIGNGRPITEEEWNRKLEEMDSIATKHGLWEAGPEALSNVLGLKILTAPMKKLLGKTLLTRLPAKYGGMLGTELGTETVTQMGQQNAEAEARLPGAEPRDWTNPEDWKKSFGEVAPETLLLTTLMGAGAGGVKAGYDTAKKGIPGTKKRKQSNLGEAMLDEVSASNGPVIDDIVRTYMQGGAQKGEPTATPQAAEPEPWSKEWLDARGWWETKGKIYERGPDGQARQIKISPPVTQPKEPPAEPPAAGGGGFTPPAGPRAQKYIDAAVKNHGYTSIAEVPDDELESIGYEADEAFKNDIVKGFMEENPESPGALYKELEDTAFEIRNVQLEGQKRTRGTTSRQQRIPQDRTGTTATVSLTGSKTAGANEADLSIDSNVRIVKRTSDTATAAFENDIPEFGVKAGDRIDFNPATGEILSGFGTGAYAAGRGGTVNTRTSTNQELRTRFSRKGTTPGQGDLPLEGDEDFDPMQDNDAVWYSVLDDIDRGYMSINEGADTLEYETGLPRDQWLQELKAEYPSVTDEDLDTVEDHIGKYFGESSADGYTDYAEESWVDDFYDVAQKTYTSPGAVTSGYTHWRRVPGWALDSDLAMDAEGEETTGTVKQVPDSERAIAYPNLGGAKSLRARLNRKEQKVVARALKNMLNAGFPKGVIDSINAFAIQTEPKYQSVSAAYDGKRHEVRFAKFVLQDMQKFREEQGYQKAIRFLLTHELTHAMESDRREYTLSMQSPLFDIPAEAITTKTVKKTGRTLDYKTGHYKEYSYNSYETSIDHDMLGPVISEMIKVWDSNHDLGSILSYPYASLSSVPNIKSERKRRAELNRIRAESFAQLGALFYTYPDLVKQHLPTGYKLFEEITRVADKKSYRERRSALRVPLQLQGAGRSYEDVRQESGTDAAERSGERQGDTRFSRSGRVGRDEVAARQAAKAAAEQKASELYAEYVEYVKDGAATIEEAVEAISEELGEKDTKVQARLEKELKQQDEAVEEEGDFYGAAQDAAKFEEEFKDTKINDTGDANSYLIIEGLTDNKGSVGQLPKLKTGRKKYKGDIRVPVGRTDEEQSEFRGKNSNGWGWRHIVYDDHSKNAGAGKQSINFRGPAHVLGIIKSVMNGIDEVRRQPDGKLVLIRKKNRVGNRVNALILTAEFAGNENENVWRVVTVIDGPVGVIRNGSEALEMEEREVKVRLSRSRTHRTPAAASTSRRDRLAKTLNVVNFALTRKQITDTVKSITKNWKGAPRIHVVDKIEDLADVAPGAFAEIARQSRYDPWIIKDIRALWDDGTNSVYLVRENIENEVDVFLGIFHEIRGHYAMRSFFGASFDAFLDSAYRAYERDIVSSGVFSRYNLKRNSADDRRTATEEFLSEMVQSGHKPAGIIDKFIAYVKEWLVSKGLRFNVSKRDIRVMLTKAAEETVDIRAKSYAPGRRYQSRFMRSKKPFYSQLEAMMLTQAPAEGTPEQYLKWLDKATKGGEKLDVDVEPLIDYIVERYQYNEVLQKKDITDLMGKDNFDLPKKFVNTYWQQTAPKKAHAQEYVEFLKNAELAATGGPVKKEEIDVTGLGDYLNSLKGQKEKLNRGDISLWINANKMILTDVYSGEFQHNLNQLVDEVYGTPQEDTTSLPKTERPAVVRKITIDDLDFYFDERLDYDDSDYSYYYDEYISENLEERQQDAADNVDRDDYFDDERWNSDVNERAQELADQFNEENAEAIEAGEEVEAEASDYTDEAEEYFDRDDYYDEDSYIEAIDEARDDAQRDVEQEASDHASEMASENADERWRERYTGFIVEGNNDRENWRLYDSDWNEIESDFSDRHDAFDRAVDYMEEEGWEYNNGNIVDADGDFLYELADSQGAPSRGRAARGDDQIGISWKSYTVSEDSTKNYRSLLLQVPYKFTPDGNYVYTTHWDVQNYLVYARLSDKYIVDSEGGSVTDSEGNITAKRVLFVEELQSDWAGNQAGMVGYISENKVKLEEARKALKEGASNADYALVSLYSSLSDEQMDAMQSSGMASDYVATFRQEARQHFQSQFDAFMAMQRGEDPPVKDKLDMIDEDGGVSAFAKADMNALLELEGDMAATSDQKSWIQEVHDWESKSFLARKAVKAYKVSVPDAPLKTSYQQVMMKRLARLAIDEGYDGIAMSKGIDHSKHRWGTNVIAWTNLKGDRIPELTRQISRLYDHIENRKQSLRELRDMHINKANNALEMIARAERDMAAGVDFKPYWTPSIEQVDEIVRRMRSDHVDSDGEVSAARGYTRVAEQRRHAQPDPDVARAYYTSNVPYDEGIRDYMKAVYYVLKYARNDDYGALSGVDLSDILNDQQWAEWRDTMEGDAPTSPEEQIRNAREYFNPNNENTRNYTYYTKRAKELKERIKADTDEVRELKKQLDHEMQNEDKVLPPGQFRVMYASYLNGVVRNAELPGGFNSQDAVYKYPDDPELAKLLQEQNALEGGEIIDLNDPVKADRALWSAMSESFATQSVQGTWGGYTESGELYRTLPKLKKRILESVGEDGKAYGLWARRAAGLSMNYDKALLSKQTGLQMLNPKMKKAYLAGVTGRDKYSYVEIDEEFKSKWGRPQVQFSRKTRPGTGQSRKIMAKIGKESPLQKALAAIQQPGALLSAAKSAFIRKTLDSGEPFKRMVAQVAPNLPADEDPYVAWRLLAGDAPIIEDWLGINGKATEGAVPFHIEDRLARRWGVSLRQVLEPVMKNKETLLDFIEYVTARRADELMAVGKENLYTQDDINYGLSLRTPLFEATANRLYQYQNNLLKYAVQGGLLSPEAAAKMQRYTNYIPFFRESEFEGDVGGKKGGVFKRLKGGRQNIRNPLENIMDNTANIIHATNRNAALLKALKLAESRTDGKNWLERVPLPKTVTMLPTKRIIDQLTKQGVNIDVNSAEEIALMQTFFQNKPIGDEKNRIIILKENGKPVAVKVRDKTLWESLHAMAPMEFGLLVDVMSFPAETIRTGIVLSPDFMAANLSRDTLSGFIQAKQGVRMVPFASSAYGMVQAATGAEIAKLYRALGAGYADIWHGDSKEANASLERLVRLGKFRPGTVLNPANYWRLLRRIGTISETGTRLSAFRKQLGKAPDDVANALLSALESREISVDFSLHGVSKTLRILERITPFLNPAKQGLYKMGRTLGDQPVTSLLRGAPLVAMTFYLWLLNRDEDWYTDLEDWEKNTYWHFDIGLRSKQGDVIPLRLPKPFEYGALFGSFQEALFQYLYDEKGEDAMLRVMSVIEDVFLLRGTPPALILPAELWGNKSSFTERPIVPAYLEGIDPRYQYGSGTSAVSRAIGEKTSDITGLSPIELDHIVRGVFGTLGMYTLMALEDPFIKITQYPERQSRHWWQQPVMRRFFSDPLRPGGKAMTEFYDTLKRQQMEQKTWKFLDFSKEYVDSLETKDSFAVASNKQIADLMGTIRKANRTIRDSKSLTPDQKRDLIDANNRQLKSISIKWKTVTEKRGQ